VKTFPFSPVRCLSAIGCSAVVLAVGLSLSMYAQGTAPDTIILKGAPMGGVKFEHKLHVDRTSNKCEPCHHASRPEKPAKTEQQACADCHTKPVQEGMKTSLQAAYHNTSAQSGTCIGCHKEQNAAGKSAPVRCTECHKRANN
jgi:hypothetical protein